jgi:hypothetical protein
LKGKNPTKSAQSHHGAAGTSILVFEIQSHLRLTAMGEGIPQSFDL